MHIGIHYHIQISDIFTRSRVYLPAKQVTTPSGAQVPMNVQASDNISQLFLAAADNWDRNERTLSRKKTTHVITRLLVTLRPLVPSSQRLPSVGEKSILNPPLAASELKPSEKSVKTEGTFVQFWKILCVC